MQNKFMFDTCCSGDNDEKQKQKSLQTRYQWPEKMKTIYHIGMANVAHPIEYKFPDFLIVLTCLVRIRHNRLRDSFVRDGK